MTNVSCSAMAFAVALLSQTVPEKTAAPPHPPPQIDTLMKRWEGNWSCDNANQGKVTVNMKKEMGGFWYVGEYVGTGTKAAPPIRSAVVFGYDTGAKAPIMLRYDNMGTVVLSMALGATPDKQVFVGEAHMLGGKTAKFRDTMVWKSANEMEHTFEMDLGKGYQALPIDVCKK